MRTHCIKFSWVPFTISHETVFLLPAAVKLGNPEKTRVSEGRGDTIHCEEWSSLKQSKDRMEHAAVQSWSLCCGLERCGSQYVEIIFVQGPVELIKMLSPSILNLSHHNLADNFSFEKKNQLNSLCCSFHSTIRQSFRPPQPGHISVM